MQTTLQFRRDLVRYRRDIAAIFDKVEPQGPLGGFFHAGFQFVFVWLWLIQTKRTCVRLCLSLRRALGTVLAIHKQAAATAKSSSIFMLVYRYIFRVVSKSKPKKSKLTRKDRVEAKEFVFFVKKSVKTCESAAQSFMGCISNRAVSRRYRTKSRRNRRAVYTCDF